jgi:hypothetical protein
VLYSRTGQFHYAERDIETLEDDQFSHVAKAFYHFWHKQPERVREYHDKLRSLKNVHGSFLVYTHCMLDEMDQSLEHYVRAVSFRPISFIDFGPLRVMCRAKLPGSLIERMEQHPTFADLLVKQGITAGRQAELMVRLNEIAAITGITVAPDEPLPARRVP